MELFVHDDRFVEAFANTGHVVLGRRLLPFSLWHQFLLETHQSKLLLGGVPTPLDLWLAVRLCSTPWNPRFEVPRINPPGRLRWVLSVGRYNFQQEMRKFNDYWGDFNSSPKFWPNQHKYQEGAAPQRDVDEMLELAAFIVHQSSISWEQVWTMPIGALRWTGTVLQKLRGDRIDIWTPEHEEMFQEHKKKREAMLDEEGKKIAESEGIPFEQARKRAHDAYWEKVNKNLGRGGTTNGR